LQGLEKIEDEIQNDIKLQTILAELKENRETNENYTLENERLHYKGRLVILATLAWISKMMKEFRISPLGGHLGVFCIFKRIAQSLYWIEIKRDIKEFVAPCIVCQHNKYLASSPQRLLQTLPIPAVV